MINYLGIFLGIFIISILVYIIKNFKEIKKYIIKIEQNKIIKLIFYILIIIILLFFIYSQIDLFNKNYKKYLQVKNNEKIFDNYDKLIEKEKRFYKNIIKKEYSNQNYDKPYIPQGFMYKEGTWNTGYVIEDINGNEYVWVPCTNREIIDVVKLQKYNFTKKAYISKDICHDLEYEEFINSALENGGFYISRYEIGKDNSGQPVSKAGVKIFDNVTRQDAINILEKMYKENDFNSKLINGYAYDTTLKWIINTNTIEVDYVDIIKNEEKYTGRNKYNNIYDIVDNTLELTMENYYDAIIVRGFPFIENDDSIKKFGVDIENLDRLAIRENDNYFVEGTLLGFRAIIYK